VARDKKRSKRDGDEGESDLSFIDKDNDYYEEESHDGYDPLDPGTSVSKERSKNGKVFKGYGGKKYVYKDYSSSEMDEDGDMEANFDDIEEEELISGIIAKREDAEELKLIQEEEKQEALRAQRRSKGRHRDDSDSE